MKIAHVLIVHSIDPSRLFESIPLDAGAWYVFFHGANEALADRVAALVSEREGRFLRYMNNRGVARSWNDGIEMAQADGADSVLLLNDDLFFYPEGYKTFAAASERIVGTLPDVGIISLYGRENGLDVPIGFSCLMLTHHALRTVGYFDETFYPAYFEDCDYLKRLRLAGLVDYCEPTVLVEHDRSSTMQVGGIAEELHRAFALNHHYYTAKWGSGDTNAPPVFNTPFDDATLGLYISAADRSVPYGEERKQLRALS